jgi:hypothetical protein
MTKQKIDFAISQLKNHETQKCLSLPHIITRVLCGEGEEFYDFR